MINQRSLENLKPFTGKNDPRRQNGRKKGQVNRATVIKRLLAEDIDPRLIFSPTTRERAGKMRGRSYLEAITYTLMNQALNGEAQAANILYRELRDVEKQDRRMSMEQEPLEITIVNSREELERLNALEGRLKDRYGEDYEQLDVWGKDASKRDLERFWATFLLLANLFMEYRTHIFLAGRGDLSKVFHMAKIVHWYVVRV